MNWALLASPTDEAEAAAEILRAQGKWVDLAEAEMVVALGGDGFMLHVQHAMLEEQRILPVFGMNLGTVGFLMNEWRAEGIHERIARAKRFSVSPLRMIAETIDGQRIELPAINEVSLLRETRQTAKLEVSLNDRIVLPELVCDGVLHLQHEAIPAQGDDHFSIGEIDPLASCPQYFGCGLSFIGR